MRSTIPAFFFGLAVALVLVLLGRSSVATATAPQAPFTECAYLNSPSGLAPFTVRHTKLAEGPSSTLQLHGWTPISAEGASVLICR